MTDTSLGRPDPPEPPIAAESNAEQEQSGTQSTETNAVKKIEAKPADPAGDPKRTDARRVLAIAGRVAKYGALVLGILTFGAVLGVVLVIRHYEARVPNVEELRS